jgi:hypothetical protein
MEVAVVDMQGQASVEEACVEGGLAAVYDRLVAVVLR